MSSSTPVDPTAGQPESHPVDLVIQPRPRDIGAFDVRRVLPHAKRRMVGPFIFFDQMGPVELLAGQAMDVRPHPHIGLATITYLFDGSIMHRDSLGTVQPIEAGAVNLMTAGEGITHSERSAAEDRQSTRPLFGIQSWIALPKALEETAPAFVHIPKSDLPLIDTDGWRGRVIMGSFLGEAAPTPTYSDTLYVDLAADPGTRLAIPADHEERAVFVLTGAIEIAGTRYEAGGLVVLHPGWTVDLSVIEPSRLLLIGGAAMDGPRHIWWNFVASDKDRIEQAKEDWRAGRFAPVPDETDFIPLPEA